MHAAQLLTVVILVNFLVSGWAGNLKYLYFNKKREEWYELPTDGSIDANWNPSGNLKVVIHGYNGKELNRWKALNNMLVIGREYIDKDKFTNVIVLDWLYLSSRLPNMYFEAAANIVPGGDELAKYLLALKSKRGFRDWSDVHLIGFSLGAHLAGRTGSTINSLTSQKIGRITGLDPAGPGFLRKGPFERLDPNDATYVDVIHCNMANGLAGNDPILAGVLGTYGSFVQSGHADFYPNGGENQRFTCRYGDDIAGCSHNVCCLIFAYTIKNFVTACACGNWLNFVRGRCNCYGDNLEYFGDPSRKRGNDQRKYMLSFSASINSRLLVF